MKDFRANQKKVKSIAVCAMLSALSVVILAVGALFDVLDISTAVFASFFCIYAIIELQGPYPYLIWGVTSVLGLILLPQKTPAVFYALFAGLYPILKDKFDRMEKLPKILLKILTFHLSLALILLVLKLFLPDVLGVMTEWKWYYPVGLYLLSVVAFILYDIAISKVILFYLYRLRKLLKK